MPDLEQRLSSVYPIILGEKMVNTFNLPVLAGKDTLNKVIDYSSGLLRKPKGESYFPWDEQCYLATRAIIVYGLALDDHPEPAYMEQLYAQRGKLPLSAKAFLLDSVRRFAAGNPAAMAGVESDLTREFMNTAKVASTTAHFEEPDWKGLKWGFSSNTRATAIILQALLETGDRDPFLSKVVKWIMQEQKVGRWRSTQENVFVVAALSDYFNAFESETPDFKAQVAIAGKRIVDAMFRGREFKTLSETKPLSWFEKVNSFPYTLKEPVSEYSIMDSE